MRRMLEARHGPSLPFFTESCLFLFSNRKLESHLPGSMCVSVNEVPFPAHGLRLKVFGLSVKGSGQEVPELWV